MCIRDRYNVGEHTLHAMKNIRSDKVLRLTMLLHDMGKPALKTMDSAGRAHFKKHAAESEVLARQILRKMCIRDSSSTMLFVKLKIASPFQKRKNYILLYCLEDRKSVV